MVAFIALFFPAVLSVWIWDAVSKAPVCNRRCLYLYSLNVMLINLGCFAIKRWILHSGEYPLGDMTPTSAINYIIAAVFLSVVLALVEIVLYKRVRIQVESNTGEGIANGESQK